MKRKKRRTIGSSEGQDLVLLAGLPRDTLRSVRASLLGDNNRTSARYEGAPSPRRDWSGLYPKGTVRETLRLVGACVREGERKGGSTRPKLPTPRRILMLYVPSRDAKGLLAELDFFCYSEPLIPDDKEQTYEEGSSISWRHNRWTLRNIVDRALGRALNATNALKAEITDKRISAFTLPARNYYYPDDNSTIDAAYRGFAQRNFSFTQLRDELLPSRFTRAQLPNGAFKGQQNSDEFFQDCRGRVFPPDLHHAPSRSIGEPEANEGEEVPSDQLSEALLVLRQRYRFGVTARNGDLHYDVQYELPRRLRRERMYCAHVRDEVLVTGSHANVGVNDVVWVPGGTKEPRTSG